MNNNDAFYVYRDLSEVQREELLKDISIERKKIFEKISEDVSELSENLDFEEKIDIQFSKEVKISWKFLKAKKEIIQKNEKESDVEIARKFIEEQLYEE